MEPNFFPKNHTNKEGIEISMFIFISYLLRPNRGGCLLGFSPFHAAWNGLIFVTQLFVWQMKLEIPLLQPSPDDPVWVMLGPDTTLAFF